MTNHPKLIQDTPRIDLHEFPPKNLPKLPKMFLPVPFFRSSTICHSAFQKTEFGWGSKGQFPESISNSNPPTPQPLPFYEALSAILLAFFAKVLVVSFPNASVEVTTFETRSSDYRTCWVLNISVPYTVCLIHSFLYCIYIYTYKCRNFEYIST